MSIVMDRLPWSHPRSEAADCIATCRPPAPRGAGASVARLRRCPSGSLRVRVYAGVDPISGKRHYLSEVTPAGKDAAKLAEKDRKSVV